MSGSLGSSYDIKVLSLCRNGEAILSKKGERKNCFECYPNTFIFRVQIILMC
jgi:hypothetical protein